MLNERDGMMFSKYFDNVMNGEVKGKGIPHYISYLFESEVESAAYWLVVVFIQKWVSPKIVYRLIAYFRTIIKIITIMNEQVCADETSEMTSK